MLDITDQIRLNVIRTEVLRIRAAINQQNHIHQPQDQSQQRNRRYQPQSYNIRPSRSSEPDDCILRSILTSRPIDCDYDRLATQQPSVIRRIGVLIDAHISSEFDYNY